MVEAAKQVEPFDIARRRRAILTISRSLFLELFMRREVDGTAQVYTFEVIENPLPDDVALLGAEWYMEADTVRLLLRSDSFPLVPDGERIPELPAPVMRQHWHAPLPDGLSDDAHRLGLARDLPAWWRDQERLYAFVRQRYGDRWRHAPRGQEDLISFVLALLADPDR